MGFFVLQVCGHIKHVVVLVALHSCHRKIREMKKKEMKGMEKWKRSLIVRMKHEDDYGVNEDSNLNLEPQCAGDPAPQRKCEWL